MKRIIKKTFLCLSFKVSELIQNKTIPLIYYHDVTKNDGKSFDQISIHKFEEQMKYLVEHGYKTVVFQELNSIKDINLTSEKYLMISFDDGYISNYSLVFPLMKKLGLKFNIFLEVGAIDCKENYLKWEMIKEMHESGLAGFGAHTYNHVDVRFMKESDTSLELNRANEVIERILNIEVEDFCFPYGAYDNKTLSKFKKMNLYKRVYTSDGKSNTKDLSFAVLGRIGIENEDNEDIFVKKLQGGYNLYYTISNYLRNMFLGGNEEYERKY